MQQFFANMRRAHNAAAIFGYRPRTPEYRWYVLGKLRDYRMFGW